MQNLMIPSRGYPPAQGLEQHLDFSYPHDLGMPTKGGMTFGSVLAALWRHRLVFALTFLTVLGGAAAIIFSLRPSYRSDAMLIIDPRQNHVIDVQLIQDAPTGLADLNFVRSEMQLLDSDELARKVVVSLHLQDNPEFADRPSPLKNAVSNLLRFAGLKFSQPKKLTPAQQVEKTVVAYQTRFQTFNDGKSFIISAAFNASQPDLAQSILSAHIAQYLADQRSAKELVINKAEAWFSEQLAEMSAKLLHAEQQQQQFRDKNHLLRANGETLPSRQLADVTTQLADARADLARKEARYGAIHGAGNSPETDTAVLSSQLIQRLREQEATDAATLADLSARLGSRHPQVLAATAALSGVQQKISREISRMSASASNDVAIARADTQQLERTARRLEQELGTTSQAELTASQIDHEIDADRRLYDDLLTRSKQVAVQREMQEPDARLASAPSLPLTPSFPQHGLLMAIATSASVLLASGAALLLDKIGDTPSQSLEEIEASCGVTGLAVLPRVRLSRRRLRFAMAPLSYLAASYQTLRNSIWFRCLDQQPRVIVFTSGLPGDGKTTVSAFFARSLAISGKRVLLIDTDLRRSGLGRALHMTPTVGLLACLRGSLPLEQAVTQSEELGLDVLGVERGLADPHNLLNLERIRDLLTEARRLYDVVVIDTPPIAAVDDALPVAALADATVLVVRWGKTPHQVIRATLRRLGLAGANVLGVALNATDPAKHASNLRDLEAYRPTKGSMFLERA